MYDARQDAIDFFLANGWIWLHSEAKGTKEKVGMALAWASTGASA